jgi:hypothetical protein
MSVSSGDEWELISNALIKDQDEAADFLARPLAPGEEISMDLQAKMTDLQDTISRLVKLDIKGKEEDQSHPADREIQSEVTSTPMDVDVMHRADIGVSPAETRSRTGAAGPESGRVWHRPCWFRATDDPRTNTPACSLVFRPREPCI